MALRILIVDDEPDLEPLMLQRFRKEVRSGAYELHFARNGLEALEIIRAEPGIQLVLTDINMPEMDGLALLEELRHLNRFIKAVVVSAYGDLPNIRLAMNRGAFDFLTKPIDFDDLQITIEKTAAEIEEQRRAAEDRNTLVSLEHELDVAASIQRAMLPRDFNPMPGRTDVALYASMTPAKTVGGDFYDFFALGEDHLGVAVGDVSGKGVPAALFMVMTRTLLKACASASAGPSETVAAVNKALCKDNRAGLFVTLFYAVADLNAGQLHFCNAGHNPPWRLHGAKYELVPKAGGIPLAIMEDAAYQSASLSLEPGDTLYAYSDGVVEAMDAAQELFGMARLEAALKQHGGLEPRALVHGINQAVVDFTGNADRHDDMTGLALRWKE